jgi:hypothetical protein
MAKTTKVEHATGKDKSKRALICEMLMKSKEGLTVEEICKKTGISVAHARTIIYSLDNLKKTEALTRYSLPPSTK